MDSKIPKPHQRKVATSSQNLFDFNSIKRGADDATKKPLAGKNKNRICYQIFIKK